jgi:hypothetical protein
LVEANADVEAQDADGRTALAIGTEAEHWEVVRILETDESE